MVEKKTTRKTKFDLELYWLMDEIRKGPLVWINIEFGRFFCAWETRNKLKI